MPEDPDPNPAEEVGMLDEQASALETLEDLVEAVRSGDVLEFVGMVVKTDGTFYSIGGKSADRHEMAGMLISLAIQRITAP